MQQTKFAPKGGFLPQRCSIACGAMNQHQASHVYQFHEIPVLIWPQRKVYDVTHVVRFFTPPVFSTRFRASVQR